MGQTSRSAREAIVHSAIYGAFSIREGNWKLELCSDSGGWSAPIPGSAEASALPRIQLYDLTSDIGETNNVQALLPETVARLTQLLEKFIADGRSTPGAPQPNTGAPIEVYCTRNPKPAKEKTIQKSR
jgi:hypothetical protein